MEVILTLATKYDVTYFRKKAIKYFLTAYPPTMKEWLESSHLRSNDGEHWALRTAILACTLDIPLLMPQVLYVAAMHHLPVLLDGGVLNDGRRVELPWIDKRTCLLARVRLMREYRTVVLDSVRKISRGAAPPSCGNPVLCETAAHVAIGRLDDAVDSGNGNWFIGSKKNFWKQANLCKPCRVACSDGYQKACQQVWDALPSYFELGTWEELKARSDN
jgi:hypothetical protein